MTSKNHFLKAGIATLLMLAVGLIAAPILSDWSSRRLANQLLTQVELAKDSEIKSPLRQLAQLGIPAIEPLVTAAASRRASVASVARQIIEQKLASWEQSLNLDHRKKASQEVQISSTALAEALAKHIDDFGPAGKQWSEQVVMRMVDFANRLPGQQSRWLLEDCSTTLAAIPPRSPRLQVISTQENPFSPPAQTSLASPEPRTEPLTRSSESYLDNPIRSNPIAPSQPKSSLTLIPKQEQQPVAGWNQAVDNDATWPPGHNKLRAPRTGTAPAGAARASDKTETDNLASKTTNPKAIDVPTPQEMAARIVKLRQLSSDELLRRLPTESFYEANIIRAVLRERGYRDEELALQQRLAASDVHDRMHLVDDTSRLPATSARRILRQLLADENAEVRLRALTALATTKTPDLKSLAGELAVHDEDPRVAELASRLLRQLRQ